MTDDAQTADGARRDDDVPDELFRAAAHDPAAREELVVRYQALAAYLARRFAGRGEPDEDLVQVANIGLLNAIDRFDPSREVRFTTYAAATIVGELKRHLRDRAWAVRVPRRLQELGLRVGRVLPALTQELGRSPTPSEIGERVDAHPDDVVEALDAARAYTASSLDAPGPGDGATPIDTMGEPDATMELVEGWTSIAPAVAELPARDRRVLYLRFFAGMTQSQIADEIGVSQMHVSRILSVTLERLRRSVADDTPGGPAPDL